MELISVYEEDKIDELVTQLYKRVGQEVERLLREQLKALGVKAGDPALKQCEKTIFPGDPKALAIYEYEGRMILGVRISDNGMGIEFDTPKLNSKEGGRSGELPNNQKNVDDEFDTDRCDCCLES